MFKKKKFKLEDSSKFGNVEETNRALAHSDSILLFYEYVCPHCNTLNTTAKAYKQPVVLCSNTACRKVIVIENIQDIA